MLQSLNRNYVGRPRWIPRNMATSADRNVTWVYMEVMSNAEDNTCFREKSAVWDLSLAMRLFSLQTPRDCSEPIKAFAQFEGSTFCSFCASLILGLGVQLRSVIGSQHCLGNHYIATNLGLLLRLCRFLPV